MEPEPLYSLTQQKVLALLPMFTGTLSVIGSLSIAFIILRDRKRKLSHVYHRIVLSMSCLDVINSTNYALSSLVVPKGTPGVWGAQGTVATCSASGFIMQFGTSVPLYSGCLAVYYLMIIRYRVKERTIAKWAEPVMHLLAIGYPLISAIIPLLYGMYNPLGSQSGWCFLKDSPINCSVNPDVPCERGENYKQVMKFSTMLPVSSNFVLIIICMTLVSLYVHSQGKLSNRWKLKQSGVNYARETVVQSFLYVFFFWLTFIWQLSVIFTSKEEVPENASFYFGWVIMIKLFLPLQGFWNFFIYVRPRFNALRSVHCEESRLTLFKSLFTGKIGGQVVDTGRGTSRPMKNSRISSQAPRSEVTSTFNADENASQDTFTKENEGVSEDNFAPELRMNEEESEDLKLVDEEQPTSQQDALKLGDEEQPTSQQDSLKLADEEQPASQEDA